jgi:hypothetical protein
MPGGDYANHRDILLSRLTINHFVDYRARLNSFLRASHVRCAEQIAGEIIQSTTSLDFFFLASSSLASFIDGNHRWIVSLNRNFTRECERQSKFFSFSRKRRKKSPRLRSSATCGLVTLDKKSHQFRCNSLIGRRRRRWRSVWMCRLDTSFGGKHIK